MSQPTDMTDETSYGRIYRPENGIIYLYLKDDVSFDIEDAKQLVRDVQSLDDSGQARLLLVQGTGNDLSFEAQRYLSVVDGVVYLALVIHSKVQAEVAQFFISLLKLFRGSYEMKVFHEVTVAEAWLLNQ